MISKFTFRWFNTVIRYTSIILKILQSDVTRCELPECSVVFQIHNFHTEWKKCRVKLDVIRSIVLGRVMLFVRTCLIPLHESRTLIFTSRWLHSFTWVWHWTFTHLTFTKHQQPGTKRAKLFLGRRGQPAYVHPYFLLTARLVWDLIGRTVNIWGHVSHFIILNSFYLSRQWSYYDCMKEQCSHSMGVSAKNGS
jgi:hypothetical protein